MVNDRTCHVKMQKQMDSSAKDIKQCIVIIPLGGIGQRVSDAGHAVPKPLVRALGEPVLYWLLKSLQLQGPRHTVASIIIPYHPDLQHYRFEDQLCKDFPHISFSFVALPGNTRGAADTLRLALESMKEKMAPDMPIISLDGDNFYSLDVLGLWAGRDALVTFEDFGSSPIYSYVRTDGSNNKRIVEIKEKEKINNLACTGAYGFSSWHELLRYSRVTLENEQNMQKNEFYISSVIRLMLQDSQGYFQALVVPKESCICLGTPLQLRAFCNDFPCRNALTGKLQVKPRRYCFDLDNTLVTFPRVPGDYTTVEPIPYMVNYVQYLKQFGHVIIIYTARRMATHKGNASAAVADIGRITLETLDRFEIPYDEICFGKPVADAYFDDLGVSAYADIEKVLGFYRTHVQPRVFNDISLPSTLQVVRKTSNEESKLLDGEIYYYNHIPLCVKDCFPIMVGFDNNNCWYEVEHINGSTISSLFLSQELSPSLLKAIMSTLHRIHTATEVSEDFEVDIYANYARKLRKCFDEYPEYSKFPGSSDMFGFLVDKLSEYEAKGQGQCAVIHGDPVMSNIIVNSFGKIKLIDMRGKLGGTLTVRGDKTYDWAKVYQSLIGYDEVLQNQRVEERYRQTLLHCFWETLQTLSPEICQEDVKLVTQSLLFSLLPLHTRADEAEKQQGYYELIERCS